MANSILLDSSFLFALYNMKAVQYFDARSFFKHDKSRRIVPDVALTEVTYLLRTKADQRAVDSFLFGVASSQFQLEPIQPDDLQRVREIMSIYSSSDFDFVDCCIMALSERLNISQIATFDRRDFPIFRPKHTQFLELLP